MIKHTRQAALAVAIALVMGGCAIVPAPRAYDDGYGSAVTVSPAIIVAPFFAWPFHRHWHGYRGHGGHRGRGRGHH